jgi:hypothetical protein
MEDSDIECEQFPHVAGLGWNDHGKGVVLEPRIGHVVQPAAGRQQPRQVVDAEDEPQAIEA